MLKLAKRGVPAQPSVGIQPASLGAHTLFSVGLDQETAKKDSPWLNARPRCGRSTYLPMGASLRLLCGLLVKGTRPHLVAAPMRGCKRTCQKCNNFQSAWGMFQRSLCLAKDCSGWSHWLRAGLRLGTWLRQHAKVDARGTRQAQD